MNKEKISNITCNFIWIIIFSGLILSVARFFYKNILYEKLGINFAIINGLLKDEEIVDQERKNEATLCINWSEIYPGKEINGGEEKQNTLIDKCKNKIENLETKIEWYYEAGFPFYMNIIEMATGYEAIIDWNVSEIGKVFILENGYCVQTEELINTKICAESLIEFQKWLEKNGISLLYVQAPYKINAETILPFGFQDYSNINADNLLNNLKMEGIEVLDLRAEMKQREKEWYSMFYVTDHHWKIDTALWATGVISKKMGMLYGLEITEGLYQLENFRQIEYPNIFLGTYGRKVTLSKIAPEDFSVIIPDFQTDMHLYMPEYELDLNGDFESLFIDYEKLKVNNYYTSDAYGCYRTRRQYMAQIQNSQTDNPDVKVLVLRDSYANSLVPFLALQYEYVDSLEPATFSGSIRAYIEETKPDIVIVMYTTTNLFGDEGGPFDFR